MITEQQQQYLTYLNVFYKISILLKELQICYIKNLVFIFTHEVLTFNFQDKFLNNIVSTANKYGFRDIHFDFEFLRPADREAYNRFLRKAKQRFGREGWLMSTALAPKTSATQKGKWYEGHDYKAHGQISDFVVIMTYEWGYSGGPAMAVSPIDQVRRVLEYAVTEMPSKRCWRPSA
jgi:spore germination protein YaaH